MALPATGVDSRQAWIVACASMGLIAVGIGNVMALVVMLKLITADFGWPRAVPSLAYSLGMLGIGAGGVAMGLWSDRAGMGPPALVGSLSIVIGLILASQATSAWHLYVAFGVFGGLLGQAAFFAPLVANATRWFQRRRGMAVALVATGQSLAGTIWPPIFRYVGENFGWRATFLYYGLFALVTLLPLVLIVRRRVPAFASQRESAASPARAPAAPVLGLDTNLVTFLLFLAQVCCCVAMAPPLVHVVAHASDLGFSMARGAEVLSVMLATSFFSRFGLGWLSDRIGGYLTLLAGSSVQALSLVLFILVDDLIGLYIVGFVFGLGFGGIVPSYAIIARTVFPVRGIGWRLSAIFTGGTVGMAAGGWMAGHVFDLTGSYEIAFLISLGFNLGNLVLIGILFQRQRGRLGGPRIAAAPAE